MNILHRMILSVSTDAPGSDRCSGKRPGNLGLWLRPMLQRAESSYSVLDWRAFHLVWRKRRRAAQRRAEDRGEGVCGRLGPVRPHQPLAKSKRSAEARARMLLKSGLGWASGVPVSVGAEGVRWLCVPERGEFSEEVQALGRAELRRARFNANRVRREFPRALPRIVGDVDNWLASVDCLLAALKPGVHGGRALPPDLFEADHPYPPRTEAMRRRLLEAHPETRWFVGAMSWRLCLQPDRAPAAFRWVRAHAQLLDTVNRQLDPEAALRVGLTLWALAEAEGEARLAPLLQWFGDPDTYHLPLQPGSYVEGLLRAFPASEGATRPEPAASGELQQILRELTALDGKTRRRALQLLAWVHTHEQVVKWGAWWRGIDRLESRCRAAAAASPPSRKLTGTQTHLKQELRKALESAPEPVDLKLQWQWVLSESGRCKSLAAWQAVFDAIPTEATAAERSEVFIRWAGFAKDAEPSQRRGIDRALRELGNFLGSADLAWWARLDLCARKGFEWEVDSVLSRPAAIAPLFGVLGHLAVLVDLKTLSSLSNRLGDLALADHRPEALLAHALGVVDAGAHDEHLDEDVLRTTVALAGGDRKRFATILPALRSQLERHGLRYEGSFDALLRVFDAAGALDLVPQLVLDGQTRRLAAVADQLALIRTVQRGAPPAPHAQPAARRHSWAKRYPSRFSRPLRLLQQVHPQPERAVGRLLATDYPDRERLKRELAALEARAAVGGSQASRLAKRIANQRARLEQAPRVGEGRQTKLQHKLERAARLAVLEEWEARVRTTLYESVPRLLKLECAQDWMLEPRGVRVLAAAARLEGAHRSLALRVLRARAGPPPWDLREEPPNAAFLARMTRRGLNMQAWLDGTADTRVDLATGPLVLRLETDPLEVALMGSHFGTCLSVDSFNFFSVFANMADVNKRVLYARTEDGTVVGRCLLGLDDAGGIVTFHPYCHKSVDFSSVVADFATELARQMGTRLVPRGAVSMLVASDWYDDGPRDLTGRHGFLTAEGPFVAAMEDLEPEAFRALLLEETDLRGLDESLLATLLGLHVAWRRPELVVALLPEVRAMRDISVQTRVAFALSLRRAGHPEEAFRLAGDHVAPLLTEPRADYDNFDTYTAEILLEARPSQLLKLLRATRERRMRTRADEYNDRRLVLAARAYEILKRPKRVREVCGVLVDLKHADRNIRKWAQRRLAG